MAVADADFQGLSVADGLTTKDFKEEERGSAGCCCIGVAFTIFSSAYSVIGAVYAALLIEGILFIGCWLCNPERVIIMRKTFPILFVYLAVQRAYHITIFTASIYRTVCKHAACITADAARSRD
ncbi:hypothetical protein F3K44_31215 [Bacillus megaterium]|nr:hypothetical protein [Priestia megaterium]